MEDMFSPDETSIAGDYADAVAAAIAPECLTDDEDSDDDIDWPWLPW